MTIINNSTEPNIKRVEELGGYIQNGYLNGELAVTRALGDWYMKLLSNIFCRLAEALRTYIENDRPFLGICLGLQLLFESSAENGPVKGFGLIPGVVGRFDSSSGCRVPHIGWNAQKIEKDSDLLDEIENRHVYFVHSYRAIPSDDNKEWVSSTCNYGGDFIASVKKGNVHAVQFHPEKSGDVGLSILRRFLNPNSGMSKNSTILSVSGGASAACSTAKAVEWDASWSNNLDPSGRAALGVHMCDGALPNLATTLTT